MREAAKRKDARIDFRVPRGKKKLIERAANLKGLSLSSYIVSTVLEDAERLVRSENVILLSNRDRDIFLSVLDQEPNETLKRAAKRYKSRVRSIGKASR